MFVPTLRRPCTRRQALSPAPCSLLLLATLLLLAHSAVAQSDRVIPTLEPGKPAARRIAAGQTHTYRIPLTSGRYLHVVAVQQGADVAAVLIGPDGTRVIEVNNQSGAGGAEHVVLVDGPAGDYLLKVRASEGNAPAGRYEVRIETLREARLQDKSQVAASAAFMQAESLRAPGTPESLREAVVKYEEALTLYVAAGDRAGEALTANNLGAMYLALGEEKKALDYFTRSLTLYRLAENLEGEAMALGNVCKIHEDRNERQQALDCYLNVLSLYRKLKDRGSEAAMLSRVGRAYDSLGEKRKALNYHSLALAAYRDAGERGGEAATLNNLGTISQELGEAESALDYFGQSLSLYSRIGNRGGEGAALANIGVVYDELGDKQRALDYYLKALPLKRDARNRQSEAATLNNIGTAYDALGEKQKALRYLSQSLSLYADLEDDDGAALALSNIGKVYDDLDERDKALDFYFKALKLYRQIGERAGEAATLGNIGVTYDDLGEKGKALEYYSQALKLYCDLEDRSGEAVTLNNVGILQESLGEKGKALAHYLQALPLFRAVGDVSGRAATLANIAVIERDRGDLASARARIEETLSAVESLRGKLVVQELRSSYFATVQGYYEFYIDLLMLLHKQQPSAGHNVAALHASERARARSLVELLAEGRVDIRQGVDAKLIERERFLQHRLNALAHEQAQLRGGQYTAERATALAKDILDISTERQQVETQIRQSSMLYAALTRPVPLTLRDIQTQVLDNDTLLLEYSLGRDRSYLWAATPTSVSSYELPGRAEIETAVTNLHHLFASPGTSNAPDGHERELLVAASRLSRVVLGPVASQLGHKRLLVIADGALRYAPFAALPEPAPDRDLPVGRPLVLSHEIVGLPSASVLPALRTELAKRVPARRTLFALADPVFSAHDGRVKRASRKRTDGTPKVAAGNDRMPGEKIAEGAQEGAGFDGIGFERLPGSRREAQRIFGIVPAGKATLALDFEASRALAVSGKLRGHRYVHFATHGRIDDLHPELSAIVLSLVDQNGDAQNGYLRLNEIFNLKLSADVVVLSGCETGLGKEIRGEGLVGLTRGFMYAGVPRVVASLWRVDDEAVAQLMISFYRAMLEGRKRPSEALRDAQIEMLKHERWNSPRHWAAFVLQGEWK